MLSHFKKELEIANIGKLDKILLAVSGGVAIWELCKWLK